MRRVGIHGSNLITRILRAQDASIICTRRQQKEINQAKTLRIIPSTRNENNSLWRTHDITNNAASETSCPCGRNATAERFLYCRRGFVLGADGDSGPCRSRSEICEGAGEPDRSRSRGPPPADARNGQRGGAV